LKNVLVIYYSQSGQLLEIAQNITKDLVADADVNLHFYNIKLKEDFPFPWNKKDFYDAFPESFLQIPTELVDLDNQLLQEQYDLIILSYQVWYLSPSIPINSFLKSEISKSLFLNTPVVTVIGCRNMWIMAQEKIKRLLFDLEANLVGNIALVDRHVNHISVITIFDWMFSGVKKRYLGIFPKPGVSDIDIADSERFGKDILEALKNSSYIDLQDKLLLKGAIRIKSFLVTTDRTANLIFSKWANFVYKKGGSKDPKRQIRLKMFSYYLMFIIWFVSPIVFILYLLSYPFLYKSKNRDRKYYSLTKLK